MTALILKALIDEANCIGCRKCSIHCPTDAIIGAARKVHTVVPDLCTGCNKCVNICPTGCIQLTTIGSKMSLQQERDLVRSKKQRLIDYTSDHRVPKTIFTQNTSKATKLLSREERKRAVAAAVARVKARKLQRITCDTSGD